jgi:hypothetical protein
VNTLSIHRKIIILFLKISSALLFASFLIAPTMSAQEKPSRDSKTATEKAQPEKEDQPEVRFVDEDGDGINDNAAQVRERGEQDGSGQQLRTRRRDHFIDQDGDGINDERCSGMGISRGQRRGQQKGGQK